MKKRSETIYIFSNGELKRKDNTIYFEGEKGRKYIPVESTSEIMIFGEVDVNKRFLEFLTQAEIILHFFNRYEYYVGSYYPREHLNSGYMIVKQAEHYLDEQQRQKLAKKFVEGALKNIRTVVYYYKRRGKPLDEVIDKLESFILDLQSCKTNSELMAVEGNARSYYYPVFDVILENPDFAFEVRTKRPPENFLNALISFGNSLLYTICLSEIYKTHLDPRIGFLHASNFRRFSLNLDIAEIFKPIIVDRLIFSLVGKKVITKKSFDDNVLGLTLKEDAMQLFVKEFEEKLATTVKYPSLGRHVSYRRLIRLEAYKIQKHIMGEEEYQPFVAKW